MAKNLILFVKFRLFAIALEIRAISLRFECSFIRRQSREAAPTQRELKGQRWHLALSSLVFYSLILIDYDH